MTGAPVHHFVLSRGGPEIVEVRVRSAVPADASRLSDVSAPFMRSGALIPRDPEFFTVHAEEFSVMETDGEVIGCAGLSRVGDIGEIFNVAVGTRWQGIGLGRILLAAMIAAARRAGFSRVVLFSRTTTRWFERQGFERADPSLLPADRVMLIDSSRGSILLQRAVPPLVSGEVLETVAAPQVRFAGSGIERAWDWEHDSLLRFAEKNGVELDSLCWAGVCGTCASGLTTGSVLYHIPPEAEPDGGEILMCISQPVTDVVIDR